MDKKSRALIVSFCLLASGTAMANDAVWGALLGGGAGAALGGSIVSGREGAEHDDASVGFCPRAVALATFFHSAVPEDAGRVADLPQIQASPDIH